MTKSELVEAVAHNRNIKKNQAESVVNCLFDAMFAALKNGEGIELRGFGTFKVRKYKSYKGRNPKSGKVVPVPEKQLPFFRAGKAFKASLNGEPHDDPQLAREQK